MLHEQKMDDVVCRDLGLESKTDSKALSDWSKMVERIHSRNGEIKIALVGKYVKLHDSYLSIVESLNHASFVVGKKVKIIWVDSDTVTDETAPEVFKDCQGIILPGGFGHRGVEGMVCSCRYARTHKVPYFGICLGMQIAVIEFARSVLGYADANSREFDELCEHPVIDLMKDQEGVIKGGTMRLGSYPCKVLKGSILERAYGTDHIDERHRHRYEFNNDFIVLGSGPIRIGQGIEFDYASVQCVRSLKNMGYNVAIINNNPETVSTDFDTADRLYFEPLTGEDVMNVIKTEKPLGVVAAFGGQTAINLTKFLDKQGIPILGTSADSIDLAEDRERFEELCDKLGIKRPRGLTVFTEAEALEAAARITYPVLLRPSYVLGGQNMIIANTPADVKEYMAIILRQKIENPVLIDKYMLSKPRCNYDNTNKMPSYR